MVRSPRIYLCANEQPGLGLGWDPRYYYLETCKHLSHCFQYSLSFFFSNGDVTDGLGMQRDWDRGGGEASANNLTLYWIPIEFGRLFENICARMYFNKNGPRLTN